MAIKIFNFPDRLKGNEEQWTALTEDLIKAVQLNPETLNVIFTNDSTLKEMHERYLNDPSETDVITFNLGDEDKIEGEIYISIDQAVRQAAEFAVSAEEEVLRLIAHGLLHLKGFDDLQEEARREMKEHEDRLVQQFRERLK